MYVSRRLKGDGDYFTTNKNFNLIFNYILGNVYYEKNCQTNWLHSCLLQLVSRRQNKLRNRRVSLKHEAEISHKVRQTYTRKFLFEQFRIHTPSQKQLNILGSMYLSSNAVLCTFNRPAAVCKILQILSWFAAFEIHKIVTNHKSQRTVSFPKESEVSCKLARTTKAKCYPPGCQREEDALRGESLSACLPSPSCAEQTSNVPLLTAFTHLGIAIPVRKYL